MKTRLKRIRSFSIDKLPTNKFTTTSKAYPALCIAENLALAKTPEFSPFDIGKCDFNGRRFHAKCRAKLARLAPQPFGFSARPGKLFRFRGAPFHFGSRISHCRSIRSPARLDDHAVFGHGSGDHLLACGLF